MEVRWASPSISTRRSPSIHTHSDAAMRAMALRIFGAPCSGLARRSMRLSSAPIVSLEATAAPAPTPPVSPRIAPQHLPDGMAGRIAEARRVLFVLGGGAVHASEPARRVLRSLGAASFSTGAGRGIVSPSDPLHFGAYLARPDSAGVAASADLVIAVGTEHDLQRLVRLSGDR